MLAKTNRLTKDKDFQNVFKKGRAGYMGCLGVKAVANGLKTNRYGVVVGNKVSKSAVIRNRIKRQIREIIRLQADKIYPGYDLVIIVRPEAIKCTRDEIAQSIEKNVKKLRLYK